MATVLRQRAAELSSIPKRGHGELSAGVPYLALLAMISLCTLCIPLPAFAATYYVSISGSDTAPGTLDAPWRTIRTSVARLQDGDVLMVQPGTYYEGNINTGIHSTPITIQATVPRQAVIDGSGHNWFGIGVNDPNPARYQGCRLIGLKIQNQKIGIGCQTTADDFYIENCEITGCTNSAIHCYSGSNWTVRNTYAHGNRNGIWFGVKGVSGVSGVLVEDCLCVDNRNPADPNTDGVLVEDLCSDTIVRRCTASGHGDQGFDIKPAGARIERCLSYGNVGGFKVWGEGIRLVNCMARNNSGTGLKLMGDRTELWNCTVAYNETGLRPQAPDNSTVIVRNTIVAFNMNKQYTTTLFDDDYNLYWVPAGQPMWRFFIGEEMHDYTIDDLAAGSLAIGPHTLLADPQFVNATGGDLTPGAQSPAIAAGVWAEFLTEDLLGNPRRIGAPPDIGAVSTWTGPAAPSVNAVSPDTGVNTGPVEVTITGAGFRVGASAKLTRAEQAEIIATGTVVDGPGQIHCTFDLSRAALGDWTVVVTNEDGQYGKLIDAFSVKGDPPVIMGWSVGATHSGGVGQIVTPCTDGYVEPRTCRLAVLRVDFSAPVAGVFPSDISVFGVRSGDLSSSVSALTLSGDDDALWIEFAPALPDDDTYTIALADTVVGRESALALSGDRDCILKCCVGDVNGSARVTITDMYQMQSMLNRPVTADTCRFDLNCSGAITITEMYLVQANMNHAAP